MPIGISASALNVTLKNLTDIFNMTSGDPTEFFVRSNYLIYGGWFVFIMLWVLGIILFRRAQEKEDQPLINAMRIFSILTILSFLARVVLITIEGVPTGLLTDFQMWIFPLITVFLAAIVKFMAD